MVAIKVLGSGCANCAKLEQHVRQAANELGLQATVEHVKDFAQIAGYGVMRTPGLVVDEKLLVAGRVPGVDELKTLLHR